jgi:hypothetical protein
MKKIIFALLILWPRLAVADTVTLDSTEVLSTPNATTMDWHVSKIDAKSKTLTVTYRWRDDTGAPIFLGSRNQLHTWHCRDIETPGENSECLDVEDPWECCTGLGTGACDGMEDTCFSDVFRFNIRSQDVGTAIGVGLRTLIWDKMKADVLTGANDGSFSE